MSQYTALEPKILFLCRAARLRLLQALLPTTLELPLTTLPFLNRPRSLIPNPRPALIFGYRTVACKAFRLLYPMVFSVFQSRCQWQIKSVSDSLMILYRNIPRLNLDSQLGRTGGVIDHNIRRFWLTHMQHLNPSCVFELDGKFGGPWW